MSTLAQTLDARRAAADRSAVRTVAKHIGGVLVGVGAWYWPIIVLAAAIIALIQQRFDALDGSTVQYVVGSARWFAFSLGVIVPLAMIRPHLAAGGTRRALFRGVVRGAGLAGASFGLVIACLYAAEQGVWRLLDLDWHRSLGLDESTGAVGFAVNAVGEGLVAFTYFLLGAAVSAGFVRFGPWLGLVVCLSLGIPAVVADIALYAGPATALAQQVLGLSGPLPALAGLLVVVVAAAATCLALHLLLRSIPVKRTVF
ncbi:hypothetical protein [Myceligenerans pegani]|uniref:Uncharacterized protein n=1 Tax=Myceligenerans pegani TaxID=2776917 RepID=A0ABR9MVN0_9MICO|nr:hypothetical protein [Myceligenerans sp. TRM 65318]MBE1875061.1 hypothetical protein [Myceligenerans sp. TRM 65318]MBE3017332.1 hypothetical protein [Myceligenerans sp. TRM 65318]